MDNSKYRFKVYKQCFHDDWFVGSSVGVKSSILLRRDLSLEKDMNASFVPGYTKFETKEEADKLLEDYLNCNNLAE